VQEASIEYLDGPEPHIDRRESFNPVVTAIENGKMAFYSQANFSDWPLEGIDSPTVFIRSQQGRLYELFKNPVYQQVCRLLSHSERGILIVLFVPDS